MRSEGPGQGREGGRAGRAGLFLGSCLDLPEGGAVGQGAEQRCCTLEPGPGPPAAGKLRERVEACSWCMDHSPDQSPSPAARGLPDPLRRQEVIR